MELLRTVKDSQPRYYFAYGSNLDEAQMQRRCPGAKWVGRAELSWYRLRFDGASQNWSRAAVANILPSAERSVWGSLYEVTEHHLQLLDGFEHVPADYQRLITVVVSPELGRCEAVTYLRPPQLLGRPTLDYLSAVLRGAIRHHLPMEYLARLVDDSGLS